MKTGLSLQTYTAAYTPFTPNHSGQRSPPTYYRGCWHVVSRGFLLGYHPSFSPRTEVYNPKTFFPHAALLGQAFAHCPIFPTAASRRSLDRISVPMWPITLSGRLPIVDLVSRYLTNYLMGREPTLHRIAPFTSKPCSSVVLCGISTPFGALSPCVRQVAHALLTRPPLGYPESFRRSHQNNLVRLACVKHAASVRPEPGSNSCV